MVQFEWLFLMQIAMGIIMVIFLQKLMQIKGQIDEIKTEVTNYILYVTQAVEEEKEPRENQEKKKGKEVEENRLIQAVLREYFP